MFPRYKKATMIQSRQTSLRRMYLFILFIMLALGLTGCTTPPVTQTSLPESGQPLIEVFFTDAGGSNRQPEAELAIIRAIDAAQRSVDLAMYNLSLDSVGDALIRASQRGVVVRLVLDYDALDSGLVAKLEQQNIPIVTSAPENLMHNKFTVIDQAEVWTGSLNLSAGAYTDLNNLVVIQSAEAAQDYTVEFEEMFLDHKFGSQSGQDTPFPAFKVGNTPVEVYFSPDDGVQDRLVQLVEAANDQIDFLAYSFTQDDLADAMLDRDRKGIEVRGVLDAEQAASNIGGEYERLADAGLDVRLDNYSGLMHHKVIVIDHQIVIFGSYNFSRAAETKNDENVMIIDDAAIAQLFEHEFEDIYAHSQ